MAGTIAGALPEDIQGGISYRLAEEVVDVLTLGTVLINDFSLILKVPFTMSDQFVNGHDRANL